VIEHEDHHTCGDPSAGFGTPETISGGPKTVSRAPKKPFLGEPKDRARRRGVHENVTLVVRELFSLADAPGWLAGGDSPASQIAHGDQCKVRRVVAHHPSTLYQIHEQIRSLYSRLLATTRPAVNLKFTGLTQQLGQLHGSYREFHSNCWVNLRILDQPCAFHLPGLLP
jgi:hypothetical protein